jgi:hypothetical protein
MASTALTAPFAGKRLCGACGDQVRLMQPLLTRIPQRAVQTVGIRAPRKTLLSAESRNLKR